MATLTIAEVVAEQFPLEYEEYLNKVEQFLEGADQSGEITCVSYYRIYRRYARKTGGKYLEWMTEHKNAYKSAQGIEELDSYAQHLGLMHHIIDAELSTQKERQQDETT